MTETFRSPIAAGLPVNENPEVALALSYALAPARPALAALIAIDQSFAAVLRSGSEPTLMQMRLLWWRDALATLDAGARPAVPVLERAAADILPYGITGTELSLLADGWEELLIAEPLDEAMLGRFGVARGGALFSLAARILGGPKELPVNDAGSGWALADLARNLSDAAMAKHAIDLARPLLARSLDRYWPASLRSIGALARLAAMDLKVPIDQPIRHGSPARVARLAWHRLSGR